MSSSWLCGLSPDDGDKKEMAHKKTVLDSRFSRKKEGTEGDFYAGLQHNEVLRASTQKMISSLPMHTCGWAGTICIVQEVSDAPQQARSELSKNRRKGRREKNKPRSGGIFTCFTLCAPVFFFFAQVFSLLFLPRQHTAFKKSETHLRRACGGTRGRIRPLLSCGASRQMSSRWEPCLSVHSVRNSALLWSAADTAPHRDREVES